VFWDLLVLLLLRLIVCHSRFCQLGKAVANVGRSSRFLIRLRILLVLMLLSDTEGSLTGSEGSWFFISDSVTHGYREGFSVLSIGKALGFYLGCESYSFSCCCLIRKAL